MISRWECGGEGRNKRDSCSERARDGEDRGGRWVESRRRSRRLESGQRWRNKGNARAEAGGGEDDEAVRWSERTEGVPNARRYSSDFHCKVEFFLRCRLIINKQPPIRSG